ncbi:cidABC operon transcriptional activator CidR [Bacillus sp. Marseille-P3661]|uniref:cidABC operon transcriptional activator CidR n=1 Tax=Bacillus sp. Marseille-P3661 TaxID=1936234 RepID=UPI000C821A89|nr:LysR family transcriptional regulator [Bacillus sp. Marseille-P3661]
MDIKHLQYFIEVTKYNSFSLAADHLYITQPTISKMIKNLEIELGFPLFERTKKNLTLTDAGQVILEQAKLVDKAFRNLELELDNLSGLQKGHIRIGLPPIFDAHLFLKTIGAFHEKYPNITFQFMEEGSKKIEEDVNNNLLDIGIVVLPTKNELFNHFTILEEDLMLLLHPSHRLASSEQVHLAELEKESFILLNKNYVLHDRIIFACNSVGYNPYIVSETTQWPFIEDMIAAKLGISLLPKSICNHLNQQKVKAVKISNPPLKWKLAIIWNKHQYLSIATKAWLQFYKEQHILLQEVKPMNQMLNLEKE